MKVLLFGIMATVVAIFVAFFVGRHGALEKCQGAAANNAAVQQAELIKIQEVVNAEAVSRGVGDIRRVLREKYTIVE